MEVTFERALEADAPMLIGLCDQCFYDDFVKYGACPGYHIQETRMLENIRSQGAYKIMADDEPVGVVMVRKTGAADYYLGCLCVIPPYQNRGIGGKAMAFLEREFSHGAHWALETPADKVGNLHFYQKHGCKVTREYENMGVKVVRVERGPQ